ncbi:MAG TPA: hypothetical protein ENO32_03040 [Mesoaciditoga lauensis]|uniref:Fibronectin type-III domain-containing protein n=1 Tax=Caldisericum exile TaxID=693075 RepID=A0A2J6X4V7_9BACT|nr:MAG: hypothetical protein C0175_05380 [Caldisericum exile]HEU24071.1 hypothetical protein [Mesoaciditoga lauensis]
MKKIGILFLVVSFFTVALILSGCMSPKYLGTPSNPSPYNGQTGVPLNPTLSWSGGGPAGDSMEYTIFFGTTPTPNSILVGNITSTSYQVSNLSPNTTYYWQIDAYDYTTGLEKTGPVWSFTTGQN